MSRRPPRVQGRGLRVVNDAPGVSANTRAHVREVIARLGGSRARLRSRRLLELVVVDRPAVFAACPYYGRVTAGILQELATGNGQLRVHVVPSYEAPVLLNRIAAAVGRGVVLVNVAPALAATRALVRRQIAPLAPRLPGRIADPRELRTAPGIRSAGFVLTQPAARSKATSVGCNRASDPPPPSGGGPGRTAAAH